MRTSLRVLSGVAVAGVALTGAVAVASGRTTRPAPRVTLIHQDFPANFNDVRYLAGAVQNVFVGRVVGHVSDVRLGRTPETQFRVVVEETLKGSVPATVTVNQEGGVDPSTGGLVLVQGDSLLVPGATYLFATRTHPNGSWQTLVNGFGDVPLTDAATRAAQRAKFAYGVSHQVRLGTR